MTHISFIVNSLILFFFSTEQTNMYSGIVGVLITVAFTSIFIAVYVFWGPHENFKGVVEPNKAAKIALSRNSHNKGSVTSASHRRWQNWLGSGCHIHVVENLLEMPASAISTAVWLF